MILGKFKNKMNYKSMEYKQSNTTQLLSKYSISLGIKIYIILDPHLKGTLLMSSIQLIYQGF